MEAKRLTCIRRKLGNKWSARYIGRGWWYALKDITSTVDVLGDRVSTSDKQERKRALTGYHRRVEGLKERVSSNQGCDITKTHLNITRIGRNRKAIGQGTAARLRVRRMRR